MPIHTEPLSRDTGRLMAASIPPELMERFRMKAAAEAAKTASKRLKGIDDLATRESKTIGDGDYEDIQRKKAETAGLHEQNRDRRVNRKLRSGYAKSVFCYLVWYSVFVAVILVLSGFNLWFSLPESVLSFLVGSTAAAAIGLVFAVTHGLFDGAGKY